MKVPTYIYFAQAVTGGKIKIGFSRRPIARLEELMSWSPVRLVLLGFAPGGPREEQALHLMFKAHWSHHEWFEPVPAILEVVDFVAKEATLPPHVIPTGPSRYRDMPHRKQRRPLTAEQRADMADAHRRLRSRPTIPDAPAEQGAAA